MQKQKTLATSFSMQGKGLHTGLDIQITFHPAPENHGYKIKRVDLEGEPVIDAVAENVAGTQRGTVLSKPVHKEVLFSLKTAFRSAPLNMQWQLYMPTK